MEKGERHSVEQTRSSSSVSHFTPKVSTFLLPRICELYFTLLSWFSFTETEMRTSGRTSAVAV